MTSFLRIPAIALVACVTLGGALGFAQNIVESVPTVQSSPGCTNAETDAKPTRPNVTFSTDTTQCGVVEADYGWSAQWPTPGTRQNYFSGSLRFGVTPKLDLRWGGDNFITSSNGTAGVEGVGDNWFGARYRFHEQSARIPSLGISYNVKVPTASLAKGLGSGYVDHAFTLLASKDLGKFHLDSNLVGTLAGAANGFQSTGLVSLACWRPLTKRLSIVSEGYGGTQVAGSPYAALLGGVAYSVSPRFVIDGAMETPASSGAPGKRVTLGATYALGNLHTWFRPRAAVQQ